MDDRIACKAATITVTGLAAHFTALNSPTGADVNLHLIADLIESVRRQTVIFRGAREFPRQKQHVRLIGGKLSDRLAVLFQEFDHFSLPKDTLAA